jgi:Cof subfamily protein (haloacid dehalogenase superfamily)
LTPLPYRAVALDLDGTLLDAQGRLPDASARILRLLSGRGVRIVLASGRMTARIIPFAEALDFPLSLIAFNGAEILERGPGSWVTVSSRPLGLAARDSVLELSRAHGVFLNVYAAGNLYGYHPAGDFAYCRHYESHTGARYAGKFSDSAYLPGEGIAKLLAIETPANRDRFYAAWSQSLSGRCEVTKSNPEYLEFLGSGVSKGSALEIWLARHSLAGTDLVAFGDAENDLEMLDLAGMGIAMANATPGLRAAYGRFSAWNNDQDAVARELSGLFHLDPETL